MVGAEALVVAAVAGLRRAVDCDDQSWADVRPPPNTRRTLRLGRPAWAGTAPARGPVTNLFARVLMGCGAESSSTGIG